ncbi:triacylglycerol lipase [Ruminococcus sp. YE71]|uniref:lipase family alpha/beta hydrolase n=1 Tax=unclassified Ruminococcus TaxID=2608920 RepID=UPI000888FC72|nr:MULTISPECIES: alpha/beta fold hydrolase [unclassified Ruminococcus]SDA27789.1 triacylglycerol lipase [Ruminococcus sp. YE78]SFW46221.1 triacylglycerol lipase [Ruminococcus sp. YE71]
MKRIIQIFQCLLLLALFNYSTIGRTFPNGAVVFAVLAVLLIHFFAFLIRPQKRRKSQERRLSSLSDGACILGTSLVLIVLEIPALFILPKLHDAKVGGTVSYGYVIGSGVIAYLVIALMTFIGLVKIAVSARQHKASLYILLFCTWFLPVVNCFVLWKFYRHAKSEYHFEQAKLDLDDMRAENQVCLTKYPIIMVHGIFFRDWQMFNYWGRIPKALAKNGARVSYASQQSANAIEVSAREIAAHIENTIKLTGAEKVNIIAHSKGGLDTRYAISKLGMDKYVATLTTINTPHRGCAWVDKVLAKAPKGLADFLDNKYNKLFTKLGDTSPSFLTGVGELTEAACTEFNKNVPDMPGVRYKSVMSRMVSPLSAGFPLNIGYFCSKPYSQRGNDGLVTMESALYWEDSEVIPDTKKRGISHGDMIDLMRENIDGFDVREYYVQLVKDMKEQGY